MKSNFASGDGRNLRYPRRIHEVEAAPFVTIPYVLSNGWTIGSGR